MPQKVEYFVDEKRETWCGYFYNQPGTYRGIRKLTLCSVEEADKGRTKKEMLAYVKKLYAEKLKTLQSTPPKNDSRKLKQLSQIWLDSVAVHRPGNTQKVYANALTKYIQSQGNYQIDQHKRHLIDRFILDLRGKSFSDTSINHYLTVLTIFFNWLFEEEYIEKPVKIKKPTIVQKEPEVFTQGELKTLHNRIKTLYEGETAQGRKKAYQNQMRALVAYTETGCRRNEIWQLPLNCISLSERYILLKENKKLGFKPKSRKEALVPISERLAVFLEEDLQDRNPGEFYYLDKGNGENQYSAGDCISRVFKKHQKELGINSGKTIHGFRATLATNLLKNNENLVLVQKLLRHANLDTTRKYIQTADFPLKEALDRL